MLVSTAPIKVKKPGFIKNVLRYRALLLMMLPVLIYLIINNYLPMFGLIIAFKDIDYRLGILGSPWAGLKNFKFLFLTQDAWVITRNTVLYNIGFLVVNLTLPVAFAAMLHELRNQLLSKICQSVLFFPYFLSFVIISYLMFALLNQQYGMINRVVLKSLGLPAIQWYTQPEYWPYILNFVQVWKYGGYNLVVFLAAIVGIDNELYEASLIDGAGKWKQFTYITFPLIQPIIIIMALLQIGRIFYADFGLFYQVTMDSGPLYSTTNVIDTYVYRAMLRLGDIGMASAAGFYQTMVGFVLVLVANYAVKRISPDNSLF